jgi:hypothetical protein
MLVNKDDLLRIDPYISVPGISQGFRPWKTTALSRDMTRAAAVPDRELPLLAARGKDGCGSVPLEHMIPRRLRFLFSRKLLYSPALHSVPLRNECVSDHVERGLLFVLAERIAAAHRATTLSEEFRINKTETT